MPQVDGHVVEVGAAAGDAVVALVEHLDRRDRRLRDAGLVENGEGNDEAPTAALAGVAVQRVADRGLVAARRRRVGVAVEEPEPVGAGADGDGHRKVGAVGVDRVPQVAAEPLEGGFAPVAAPVVDVDLGAGGLEPQEPRFVGERLLGVPVGDFFC